MSDELRFTVDQLARRRALRDEFDQLMEHIQHTFPDDLERCFTMLLDLTDRRAKHEKCKHWMLKRLDKTPHLTAVRVASEARFYFRMPFDMMPWLIQTARTVKARVRMRTFRSRLKADIEMGQREAVEGGVDV